MYIFLLPHSKHFASGNSKSPIIAPHFNGFLLGQYSHMINATSSKARSQAHQVFAISCWNAVILASYAIKSLLISVM